MTGKIHSRGFIIYISCYIFIFCFYSQRSSAQHIPASFSNDDLKFVTIREEDGLSNKSVTSIIQDHYGFMWFATYDGLNRYDGAEFKIFRHIERDSTSICSNKMKVFCEDDDGNIWGMGTQLFYYSPVTNQFKNFSADANNPLTFPAGNITGIAKDRNGDLWMSCYDADYFLVHYNYLTKRFEGVKKKDFPEIIDAEDCGCMGLTIGSDNMIYLVAYGGMIRFNPEKHSVEFIKTGSYCNSTIFFDHPGCAWTDKGGLGLFKVDFNTHSIRQFDMPAYIAEGIRAISWKSNHELWLANEGNGLWVFDTTAQSYSLVKHRDEPYSFTSEKAFYCLYTDRSGTQWFGSHNGLFKLDPLANQFKTIGPITRPPIKQWKIKAGIQKVAINPVDGKWYIGCDHGEGLYAYDTLRHSMQLVYRMPWKNYEAAFEDLIVDQQGNIWFIDRDVVYCMRNAGSKQEVEVHKLSTPGDSFSLTSLMEDKKGKIWIGTEGNGCFSLQPETKLLKHYAKDPAGKNAYHFQLCNPQSEDSKGNIWFFDYHHFSCLKQNEGTFDHYECPHYEGATERPTIIRLAVDNSDHVWLVINGQGLTEFDPAQKQFHFFGLKEGLPHTNLRAAAFDEKLQQWWLYSDIGIISFSIRTKHFDTYRITEGLYAGDGISKVNYSLGKVLVGFWDGHISFADATKPHGNLTTPVVVFTSMEVNGKPFQFTKPINDISSIKLNYNQNLFSFSFAALNFTQPQKNQYAYKLDDIDRDWVYSGNRHQVSYNNVPPGKYLFHVKASNNTGLWNDDGKTLLIIITPAWWQTWWFKLALLLAVSAIIIFLIRQYIEKKMFKQKVLLEKQLAVVKERERITADLHDDVGATLSSIHIYGDLANTVWDEQPKQSKEMVSKISSQSRELMTKMSDIVWSLKSPAEEKNSFLLKIKNYCQDLLAGKGIAANFDMDEKLDIAMTNPLARKNLLLITREAINNITKYSGATEAFVTLKQQENEAQLTIRDNGKGFDKAVARYGNGLGNIEQRCRQLNGTCTIESGPGKGVTITCCFPIAIISHTG